MYNPSKPSTPSTFTKDGESYSFVCRCNVSVWVKAAFEGYAFPVDYQVFDTIRIRSTVYGDPPTDRAYVSITCGKQIYEKYNFVQAIYNGYCYIFATSNPFYPLYINPNKYVNSDSNSSDMTQDIFQTLTLIKINPTIDDVILEDTPKNNSTNPITSGGVKSAIDDVKNTYQKKLTFDAAPTAGSTNPVTSDGIKTALNSYVGIYKGDSSNFHVKNNEYYSFICRTNISNWEKIQADFFCANSDSSTVGKFNIFATLSTTDTSLHTPERVAELGGIVWDYNYKGYNAIKYRIYVAKSGDNFYFYAKRNSSNDKSITAFRSCLLYTTNQGLTDNVSADLDDATWQTLSLVEMKNVYSSTTQERLDSHKNDTTVHITEAERTEWNAKASTSVATTSANGLMSKTDKSKLDGISSGANKADVSYANSKLTKTIDGTSSDVFAASEIITDTNTFGNFAAVTDVNVDGTIYHTYWKIAPTSSNNVFGFAVHPTIGVLFRIQNNKGRYYAIRYDNNTTYIFDGTYDSSTNKAATVSSITSRIDTAKTELTSAIDSEASARESADTTLQSNIDTVGAKGIVINEINGENVICFE